MKVIITLLAIFISLGTFSGLRAENKTVPDSTAEQLPGAGYLPESFLDTTAVISSVRTTKELKSPLGAVGRAVLIPGWGQIYTGKYVRGTVTAVMETGFFAVSIHYLNRRNDLRDQLREIENNLEPDNPQVIELNRRVKSRNRLANDYLAYGLTTLLLSMIDSYVSAHLYNFEDNFQVMNDGERIRTSLAWKF